MMLPLSLPAISISNAVVLQPATEPVTPLTALTDPSLIQTGSGALTPKDTPTAVNNDRRDGDDDDIDDDNNDDNNDDGNIGDDEIGDSSQISVLQQVIVSPEHQQLPPQLTAGCGSTDMPEEAALLSGKEHAQNHKLVS